MSDRDEIARTLQPLGDQYFDSTRAWRNDAYGLVVAAISAGLDGLALTLEYRNAGVTSNATLLSLILSLVGTGVVALWATFLGIGMKRILAGSFGPLPGSIARPRNIVRFTLKAPAAERFNFKSVPVAWHSPFATTLWRLRLALLVTLGGFLWSILNTGAIVATHVLSWAPVVILAFGSLISLCIFTPYLLVDNARRRFRDADIDVFIEPTTLALPIRIGTLIMGVVLLVLSFVQLAQRAIPLVEDSVHLKGQVTTTVELPRSTQTVYAGCNGDLQCSPLDAGTIKVTSAASHVELVVTDDQGVDHQSFDGHPWLSVANVVVPTTGRYLVALGGSAHGQYRMALSQSAIFRTVLPLIVGVIWRVIALWLTAVAIYETFFYRRTRRS